MICCGFNYNIASASVWKISLAATIPTLSFMSVVTCKDKSALSFQCFVPNAVEVIKTFPRFECTWNWIVDGRKRSLVRIAAEVLNEGRNWWSICRGKPLNLVHKRIPMFFDRIGSMVLLIMVLNLGSMLSLWKSFLIS